MPGFQIVVWNQCSLSFRSSPNAHATTGSRHRHCHVTLTVTFARLLILRSFSLIFEEKRDCSQSILNVLYCDFSWVSRILSFALLWVWFQIPSTFLINENQNHDLSSRDGRTRSLHLVSVPGSLFFPFHLPLPQGTEKRGTLGTRLENLFGESSNIIVVLAFGHVLSALVFGHSRWYLYTIIIIITRLKPHISPKLLSASNGLSSLDVCVVSCNLLSYIRWKLYLPSGLWPFPKHWLKPMKRQISNRVPCILAVVFFLPRM